jgi:hypothetical protein
MAMIRETAADEERDWLLVAASALYVSLYGLVSPFFCGGFAKI